MMQHTYDIDIHSYDKYLVAFSAGKDSTALVLYLLDMGVNPNKIELHHHDIDGASDVFMDWECTPGYCKAFAAAFGIPVYFSWKDGGFKREMLRKDSATAAIYFETPDGEVLKAGGAGPTGTRMKFPQVSPDLSVRWCSAYLKIDVLSAAIRNQSRFNGIRTLVLSGERGEESPARAKYNTFEQDRAHSVGPRTNRHVDRLRPILHWSERMVWEIIEKYKVRVHPAYYLGWGRVSCKFCIFGNANQYASAFHISPEQGTEIADYEVKFGCTIKRKEPLIDLIKKGKLYEGLKDNSMVQLATSHQYNECIFMDNWILPLGAYGESCGPL